MRPRVLDNGQVIYPVRGNPPPDMPGYVRDPGNPYVFIPIWPPCKFRGVGERTCDCPADIPLKFYTCQLGIHIIGDVCKRCDKRVEPASMEDFRQAWKLIHTDTNLTHGGLKKIVAILPCQECIFEANKYIEQHPEPMNFEWTVAFHNAVNLRLGKPELSIGEAKLIWGV